MSASSLHAYHPFRSADARDRYLTRYDELAKSWPIPSETRMVATEHGRTFVRIGGPADAPPLVLLPGTWNTSLQWTALISAFSERYRTCAVDNLYDFGRSVSALPAKTTPEYMAWLDGLFDALELPDGIHLLGATRGAWLAAEYALHAPQRLVKVAWLTPVGIVRMTDLSAASGMPAIISATAFPSEATIGAMMRWMMPDGTDAPWFDEWVSDIALAHKCFDMSKVGRSTGPRMFSDDELRDLKVPALYLAGEEERMCSVPACELRLKAVAPQIETAVFLGAGHSLLGLQPKAVATRVLEFLDG